MATTKSTAQSSSFSFSAEAGVEGFASASAGTDQSSESSTDSTSESSTSSSSNYSTGNTKVYGQINTDMGCGGLTGDEDILFPIEYQTKPLYTLFDNETYATQNAWMKNITDTLLEQGLACASDYCSGYGTCYQQEDLFSSRNYTQFVVQPFTSTCLCSASRMGDDCSETFSEAAYYTNSTEDSIQIHWFAISEDDDRIKQLYSTEYDEIDDNFYAKWYVPVFGKDSSKSELMIFSSFMTSTDFTKSTANAQTYVIAANRSEAIDSMIFTEPIEFLKQNTNMYIPSCDPGYSAISSFPDTDWDDKDTPGSNAWLFVENTLHCIDNAYMISSQEASSTYGASTSDLYYGCSETSNGFFSKDYDWCIGAFSTFEYTNSDKTNKFKFGKYGTTAYPGMYWTYDSESEAASNGASAFSSVIDFGNEKFEFTDAS